MSLLDKGVLTEKLALPSITQTLRSELEPSGPSWIYSLLIHSGRQHPQISSPPDLMIIEIEADANKVLARLGDMQAKLEAKTA